MTEEQVNQAQQMHDSGITWDIIAAYFGITKEKLLQLRKHYSMPIRQRSSATDSRK